MKYVIYVLDYLDLDKPEPWSYFGAYGNEETFKHAVSVELPEYMKEHRIMEVKIKVFHGNPPK